MYFKTMEINSKVVIKTLTQIKDMIANYYDIVQIQETNELTTDNNKLYIVEYN
ncbi:MAG: hypothetical protein WCR54_08915 [Clostridia bacterium]